MNGPRNGRKQVMLIQKDYTHNEALEKVNTNTHTTPHFFVDTVTKATSALSDVIRGLHLLHLLGMLSRHQTDFRARTIFFLLFFDEILRSSCFSGEFGLGNERNDRL